ncbi:OprO/OprP family phosphate-selective porin [Myxococcota bacterium]|nr:OprO/OprP family phosphate-selective porin [Myxococcota bacterium]
MSTISMQFSSLLLTLLIVASAHVAVAARVEIIDGENVDMVASTSRGLLLRFKDPDLEFRVGGRIHGDITFNDSPLNADPTGRLRRGRVYLSGRLFDDFRFKIERELAPDRGEFRNLWVAYHPTNRVGFKAGNFIAPFGLEQLAASNYLTFMERSISGAVAPSFQSGVLINTNGRFAKKRSLHRWTWAASVGGPPLGQTSDDPHRTEHWAVVSRATYSPIARRSLVVHFGGAAEYRDVLGDDTYRIGTRVEASQGPRLLETGAISNVDSVVSAGAEVAAMFGPILIQSEYQRAFLQRNTGGDLDFGGGYVQASWVLTGEHREYSRQSGSFGSLTPDGDWGALELAGRFSVMDLNDGAENGGEAQSWTVGANWYIRRNLRLMFNYVRVDAENQPAGEPEDPQIFQARAALFF